MIMVAYNWEDNLSAFFTSLTWLSGQYFLPVFYWTTIFQITAKNFVSATISWSDSGSNNTLYVTGLRSTMSAHKDAVLSYHNWHIRFTNNT